MPRVMTAAGQELLERYPVWQQGDKVIQAVCNAAGEENRLMQEALDRLERNAIATTAEEHLAIYERMLEIPVAAGASLQARKDAVLLGMRRAAMEGTGLNWELLASTVFTGSGWSYFLAGVNFSELTVRMPYAAGSIQAELAETLLRSFTDASLTITVIYDQGFILDESLLGEDNL